MAMTPQILSRFDERARRWEGMIPVHAAAVKNIKNVAVLDEPRILSWPFNSNVSSKYIDNFSINPAQGVVAGVFEKLHVIKLACFQQVPSTRISYLKNE